MTKAVLCDTCVLVDFVNGHSQQINELHTQNVQLFINPVIELELLQGTRNKGEMQRLEKYSLCFITWICPLKFFK